MNSLFNYIIIVLLNKCIKSSHIIIPFGDFTKFSRCVKQMIIIIQIFKSLMKQILHNDPLHDCSLHFCCSVSVMIWCQRKFWSCRYTPNHLVCCFFIIVDIMTASTTECEGCRICLISTTSTSNALLIIITCWGHVALENSLKASDINTHFHCGCNTYHIYRFCHSIPIIIFQYQVSLV